MSSKSSSQKIKQAGQIKSWITAKKKGEMKGLMLRVGSSEIKVKLKKKLRKEFVGKLQVGDTILIDGVKKIKDGKIRSVKAKGLIPLKTSRSKLSKLAVKSKGQKIRVGVCQKSNCCRKGATKVLKALKQSVKQNHWGQQVEVCSSSCLGRCKSGPVVVSLPKKKKYQNVRPCDVTNLIKNNLLAS